MVVHTCTSAHRRLRPEGPKFKASLGYIARPCRKKKKKTPKRYLRCYESGTSSQLTPVILVAEKVEI
jgi:hypothetical protein